MCINLFMTFTCSSSPQHSLDSDGNQINKFSKYVDTFDDDSLSRPKDLDDDWCYILDKNAGKRSTSKNTCRYVVGSVCGYNVLYILEKW